MIENLITTIKELPKTFEKPTSSFLDGFSKGAVWNEPKDNFSKSTNIEFGIKLDDSQVVDAKKISK